VRYQQIDFPGGWPGDLLTSDGLWHDLAAVTFGQPQWSMESYNTSVPPTGNTVL